MFEHIITYYTHLEDVASRYLGDEEFEWAHYHACAYCKLQDSEN
jgi:hypothetical protein